MDKIIILDNIRSAHNVGSIFRTADGAGVKKIYLLGYTPAPIDRFGRKQTEIAKTSLDASEFVSWESVPSGSELSLIQTLKSAGYQIVAVEQSPQAVDFYNFKVPDKVCYILGNEVNGVGEELLKVVDTIVEIPMAGKKESLNVSVTTGIILFKR